MKKKKKKEKNQRKTNKRTQITFANNEEEEADPTKEGLMFRLISATYNFGWRFVSHMIHTL